MMMLRGRSSAATRSKQPASSCAQVQVLPDCAAHQTMAQQGTGTMQLVMVQSDATRHTILTNSVKQELLRPCMAAHQGSAGHLPCVSG